MVGEMHWFVKYVMGRINEEHGILVRMVLIGWKKVDN